MRFIPQMTKLLSAALFTSVAAYAFTPAAGAAETTKVFLNGNEIHFKTAPETRQDYTTIEFRPLFESLGMNVGWEPETQTITGQKSGLTIEIQLGSLEAKVNGTVQMLPVAPYEKNGISYVPLRFVGESTGLAVEWYGDDNVVQIGQQFDVTKLAAISEGILYPIYNGRDYGFMDRLGNVVVDYQYNLVGEEHDGLIAVEKDNEWGYIDKQGHEVIAPHEDFGRDFIDGISVTTSYKGEHGAINKSGAFIIPYHKYDDVIDQASGEGRIGVINYGKGFGYVGLDGQEVIPLIFQTGEAFSEGLASVMYKDKYGFIDTQGSWVIEPKYAYAGSFQEGMALVAVLQGDVEQYGYIDKQGKMVISPRFQIAMPFSEGVARVLEEGKGWGVIDQAGQYVIAPVYDDIMDFHNGLVLAVKDGNYFYMNKNQEVVYTLSDEEWGSDFLHGLARIFTERNDGMQQQRYIDTAGQTVWESDWY